MKCNCLSHNGFLTSAGYAEVAQRERERHGVDNMDASRYLDIPGSVSALIEIETDYVYDPTHVELNHRSTFLQLEMFDGKAS